MAKTPKKWTHKQLCDKAVSWLKRPQSRGSHGCHIAVSEAPSGWSGEIPDAIGFRSTGWQDGSVLVEVKVSRSDFLADKKKPHRNGESLGLGRWRYYMCPEGMIRPDELPEKWGLLYVTNRGGVKPVVGPASLPHPYSEAYKSALETFGWDRDMEREQFLLVKLLARVGDPEKLNNLLRAARNEAAHWQRKHENYKKSALNEFSNSECFS